jgi:hypothetical protein
LISVVVEGILGKDTLVAEEECILLAGEGKDRLASTKNLASHRYSASACVYRCAKVSQLQFLVVGFSQIAQIDATWPLSSKRNLRR